MHVLHVYKAVLPTTQTSYILITVHKHVEEDVESLIITVVHRIRISRGMEVQMDKMGLRKIRSINMAMLKYESLLKKCYHLKDNCLFELFRKNRKTIINSPS